MPRERSRWEFDEKGNCIRDNEPLLTAITDAAYQLPEGYQITLRARLGELEVEMECPDPIDYEVNHLGSLDEEIRACVAFAVAQSQEDAPPTHE